jgi:carbon storage regulator
MRGFPGVCAPGSNVIEWLRFGTGGALFMLVLTRKSNQSIMIGDDIEVSVLSIMGEKVRIGIQAPRDIPVFRKEVYLEIQEERGKVGARAEVDAALEKMGRGE